VSFLLRQTRLTDKTLGTMRVVTDRELPTLLVAQAKFCLDRFIERADDADLEEAQECLANLAVYVGSGPRSLMDRAHIRAEREGPLVTTGLNNRPRVWAVIK